MTAPAGQDGVGTDAWRSLRRHVLESHRRGLLAEAESGCERLLTQAPRDAAIVHLLGIISAQTGRLERAIGLVRNAIALDGNDPSMSYNLGRMLWDAGRIDESLQCFTRVVELRPGEPDALFWRGNALRMLHRPLEALASFDAAMARRPLHPETLCARAGALQDLGRVEEALRAYEALTARFPDYAQANYQKGLCRLQMGRWEGAWALTEWRRRLNTRPLGARVLPMPLWTGVEPLQDRTLLVHFEQGLGDTLQMYRFVGLATKAGARVVLLVQEELRTLLLDQSPLVRVITEAELPVEADFHCPLFSLPAAFGTTLETLPSAAPFLATDPVRSARWRERLGTERRLRVGVVWAGGQDDPGPAERAALNARRNLPLAALASLGHPGVAFYSLQKGAIAAAELAAATAAGTCLGPLTDLAAHLIDFAETAAVLSALDLVISVDTSVVHLAGVLGRPAWLLNRFDSCWRWLHGREDSPWYPSLRIYPQERAGDWSVPLARIAADLARLAERRVLHPVA